MMRRLFPVWCTVMTLVFLTASSAQDHSAMWNAAKRWKLGIDAAPPGAQMVGAPSEATRNPRRGDNPDSPPNTPDIQVFNPSLFWQSENSIGVSFTNPNHLMVSTNGRIPGSNPVVHQPWAFSTDGGVTWPASMQSEDLPPNIIDSFGDPVAFFDVGGKAYYCTLGSPGGIYFVTTTDFGTTWSARANADNINSTNDDKQHATADFSGTFPNNVYAAWTDFGVTGTPIQLSRSTDRGVTWLPRVALPIGSNRGQGVHIAIGPNGEVYPMWAHYTTGTAEVGIGFAKSTDGGATFSTPAIAFPINGIRISNGAIAALNGTRAASFPYHDVDRSNGPRRGWIYVVTPELDVPTSGQADIYLRRSTDGGTTWSSAVKVNGPDVVAGRWQWMPSIAVDPTTGGITVGYYSFDSTGSTTLANRYAAYSVDGGQTWDTWVVSDVRATWAPQGTPSTNTVYNGDYYETAAAGGKAWVLWTDRRSGTTGASNKAYIERIIYGENFGWIRGTVTNTVGGAPIQGVAIDFLENVLQQSGTSDAAGLYFAGALVDTPGTTANLTLRARRFGFLDTTLAVTLTRNDTLTRNFGLRPLDLVLTRDNITFPETPVPGSKLDSLTARNQFASPLTLSSLTTTNSDFAVSPTSVVIPAMDSVKIYVTYTPTAEGTDTGRVIVMSNSIYTPRKDVTLNGTAIGVPLFTANVDSLTRTLEGGARDSVTFRIRNTGTTSGDFSARAIMFPQTGPGRGVEIPLTIDGSSNGESTIMAQFPELLYYKFDEAGSTTTQNFAVPGVGTNPAPVTGQTFGGTGQFGSALIGTGTANHYVNTGWNTALGNGSWTISLWLNNLPNNTTLYYLFGDNTASSFRCFLGGAAGAGAITLRGTGITNVDVPGVAPGPTVVHFVYDASALNIKAYRNGVLVATVAQSALNINGTAPFRVGTYSTSASLPSGALMDEFRMYNRALTDVEISTTWNSEVGTGNWFSVAPTTGTVAMNDSITMKAYFDATDETIYNNPGTYYGRLDVIATNSALADTLRIPSRLFVVPPAGPRLAVDKDSLDFGVVQIDSSRTRSILVRNIGAASLSVTNITMTNTSFSANPTSFTLASLDTVRVNVTFTAPAPGAVYAGTMSFVSNDPSAPSLQLQGSSLGAPSFRVRLDSLTTIVEAGNLDSIQFYMRNAGTGLGEFSARVRMFQLRPGGDVSKPITLPVTVRPAGTAASGLGDPITDGYDPSAPADLHRGTGGTIPMHYNFNTGGAGNTFPFNISAGKRIQWIYLPGDFSQPSPAPQGRITKLYFRISIAGSGVFSQLEIKMGQTTLTELPSNDWYAGPLQVVYSRATDSLSAAAVGDWVSIELDFPFAYDPTQSLVIDVNQCARVGTGLSTYHTGISGVRRLASTVGASCPLPFANTSTLMAHCGIDVSGGTWLSLEPTQGSISVGDSVLMTAYFDATDTSISNNPGNYFGEVSVVATNSTLADTLSIPVRLLVTPSTGVTETGLGIPDVYTLEQNYPNPFNPSTTIKFGVPTQSFVKLTIYNILGQEVAKLSDEVRNAGYFLATWDGTNKAGTKVSSGVYFYRMEASSTDGEQKFTNLKKMLLLK